MEFGDPRSLKAFLVFLEDLHWLVVALQEVVINLLGNLQTCLCSRALNPFLPITPHPVPAPPQVAGCGEPGSQELQWTRWTWVLCFNSSCLCVIHPGTSPESLAGLLV